MKILFVLILLGCILSATSFSQELSGKVENHPNKAMDVVLMLFGLDHQITVGKVDKKGELSVNLEGIGTEGIPEDIKSMFMGRLVFNFFFTCGDFSAFGEVGEKPASRQDYLRFTRDGQWTGTAFLVSDERLRPWLEDSGYQNAVQGSFYEIIYVEEDLIINTTCNNQVFVSEGEMVDVTYDFQLELKKGFNWVEYEIQEVFDTNPEIPASFPSKVKITNLQDPSSIKWIGTYY
ncbi:MAG: hypothetical protein ACQEW9_15585 [Bacteroidota bacterium]